MRKLADEVFSTLLRPIANACSRLPTFRPISLNFPRRRTSTKKFCFPFLLGEKKGDIEGEGDFFPGLGLGDGEGLGLGDGEGLGLGDGLGLILGEGLLLGEGLFEGLKLILGEGLFEGLMLGDILEKLGLGLDEGLRLILGEKP